MKINTNNIPIIRILMIITAIYILPLSIGVIGMVIQYKSIFKEPILGVFFITIILIIISTVINVSVYFKYKRKVIFEKNIIYINGIEYLWQQVKIEFLGMGEIFSFSHKTIRLEYFNKEKNIVDKTYIKGNIDKYNSIVSIRN